MGHLYYFSFCETAISQAVYSSFLTGLFRICCIVAHPIPASSVNCGKPTPNNMILEIAMLEVKPGLENNFEKDFALASRYISAIEGYIDHSLNKCLEQENKYALLVRWQTLEAHTVGFRESAEYLEWKRLLHHYYDPFPVVEHFEETFKKGE